jgi:hypothetical protein
MNTLQKMTKIQAHFEDSNLELDLRKDVDGHYLNEVARYAWMNFMTAYSFGRMHQANIANKAIPNLEHIEKAIEYMGAPVGCNPALWFIGVNMRINEIARAKQSARQDLASLPENLIAPETKAALGAWIDTEQEYITAEEARALGAGNAEWRWGEGHAWALVSHKTGGLLYSRHAQYRAIKQAQPEPVKEYDEAAFLKRFEQNLSRDIEAFFRVIKPVDEHAALRAEYAKQVAEGTTGFYLWELKDKHGIWLDVGRPGFASDCEYRCTDISCYVSKDGEPAIRMLRTEAQELQRSLVDTVEWNLPGSNYRFNTANTVFDFNFRGTYTYRTKTPVKQVDWSNIPVGVAVQDKETNTVWLYLGTGVDYAALVTRPLNHLFVGMRWVGLANLTIAPATDQPWIALQDEQRGNLIKHDLGRVGFIVELHESGEKYRITGIAEGWNL